MLNKLINSEDFLVDLEKAVESTPSYKALEENFFNTMKGLCLSKDAHDEIDDAVGPLVAVAIKEACRIGLANGVSLVIECISAGHTPRSIDYNQAMTREDYRKAWDMKAEAYNRLMDLLTEYGVDDDTAMKAVNEYEDGVGAYALISAKLSIPEAI